MPPSILPPSQNEAQARLNQGLSGACFGNGGGGKEGGIFEVYEESRTRGLDYSPNRKALRTHIFRAQRPCNEGLLGYFEP